MNDTVLHGEFTSQSCRFHSFDLTTGTLHVDLIEEGRYGFPHWFEFEFAPLPHAAPLPGSVIVSVRNAGASAYANGWRRYRPFVARSRGWERVEDEGAYDDGCFRFRVSHVGQRLRVAWYEPYGLERLHRVVQGYAGRDMARVSIQADGFVSVEAGDPALPAVILIARQHPGEAQSSFFTEGFMSTLLDAPGASSSFFSRHSLIVLPMMNTSGVRKHLHRMDETGTDYNRVWGARTAPPAVQFVRSLLRSDRDIRLFADIHGDEVSRTSYITYQFGNRIAARDMERLTDFLTILDGDESRPLHVWKTELFAKRFARALIRQHRVLIRPGLMAEQLAARAKPCLSLTYELSAADLTPTDAFHRGTHFADALATAMSPSGDRT